MLVGSTSFNTNSTNNWIGIDIINAQNAGAGENSGLTILNLSGDFVNTARTSGAALTLQQSSSQ